MGGVVAIDPLTAAEIALRTAVVYVALLVGLRVAGKRELGQMTVFDLVVLLVIANAVQNAMVGDDTSLTGGLIAAATLLVLNGVVLQLGMRSRWLRERLRGTPTLLVHDGKVIARHLRQEGLGEEEVMQALREHGIADAASVKSAVLEVDGTISVITDATSTRTRGRLRGLRTK